MLILGLVVLYGQKTFSNIRSYLPQDQESTPTPTPLAISKIWFVWNGLLYRYFCKMWKCDLLREGFWGVFSHLCFSSSQILSNLLAFLAASSGPPMSNKSVGTRPPCWEVLVIIKSSRTHPEGLPHGGGDPTNGEVGDAADVIEGQDPLLIISLSEEVLFTGGSFEEPEVHLASLKGKKVRRPWACLSLQPLRVSSSFFSASTSFSFFPISDFLQHWTLDMMQSKVWKERTSTWVKS